MGAKEMLASAVMMTIGALIAGKFKTRETAAEAFDKLKLTWAQGIALAIIIVFLPMLAIVYGVKYGIIPVVPIAPTSQNR